LTQAEGQCGTSGFAGPLVPPARRSARIIPLLIGVLWALVVSTSSGASSSRILVGAVRTAHIALKGSSGSAIRILQPGTYIVVVKDQSRSDNFVLVGTPMTNVRRTGLSFVGTVRWRLELKKGTYMYFSTAHRRTMRGTFRVV
jgi:hypothetical protein